MFIGNVIKIVLIMVFFDPEKTKIVSYETFKNYDKLMEKSDLDNKDLWKSDYDLWVLNKTLSEDRYKLLRNIKYFLIAPSDKLLNYLKEIIKKVKLDNKKFGWQKYFNQRYSMAKKVYGENSLLSKSFKWPKNSADGLINLVNETEKIAIKY